MSNSAPQFSIVIPSYNRGYCVRNAISSVQAQTLDNWELIVVDDGSTDNTREVVKEISSKDERIKYVYQDNGGVSAARQRGWDESVGNVIVYLDSDDKFFPNFLEKVTSALDKNPKGVFGLSNHYRHIILVDKDDVILREREAFVCHEPGTRLQDIYYWDAKITGSGIFHKRVLAPQIKWDEWFERGEDWDFILQCGRLYADKFIYLSEPLVYYAQKYGVDGICGNTSYAQWAEMFQKIYQKHKEDPLLEGQTWYPERIERYTEKQRQFEAGEIKSAMYKYFP